MLSIAPRKARTPPPGRRNGWCPTPGPRGLPPWLLAISSPGIVVDLRQRQVDRVRHADDEIQARIVKELPDIPPRDDQRHPSSLLPGAPNGTGQSCESCAVEKVQTRQVDDHARFTKAQADGSPERRDRGRVQASFHQTHNGDPVRDDLYLEPGPQGLLG